MLRQYPFIKPATLLLMIKHRLGDEFCSLQDVLLVKEGRKRQMALIQFTEANQN